MNVPLWAVGSATDEVRGFSAREQLLPNDRRQNIQALQGLDHIVGLSVAEAPANALGKLHDVRELGALPST